MDRRLAGGKNLLLDTECNFLLTDGFWSFQVERVGAIIPLIAPNLNAFFQHRDTE